MFLLLMPWVVSLFWMRRKELIIFLEVTSSTLVTYHQSASLLQQQAAADPEQCQLRRMSPNWTTSNGAPDNTHCQLQLSVCPSLSLSLAFILFLWPHFVCLPFFSPNVFPLKMCMSFPDALFCPLLYSLSTFILTYAHTQTNCVRGKSTNQDLKTIISIFWITYIYTELK